VVSKTIKHIEIETRMIIEIGAGRRGRKCQTGAIYCAALSL
jgi:hypothetical protein